MTLPPQPVIVTADLYDLHHQNVGVVDLPLRSFGGLDSFFGPCQTLRVERDHRPVLAELRTPGLGRILVVDAIGHVDTGVMGDRLAAIGVENGWRGVVVAGAIRDSRGTRPLPFGVMALGVTPRKGWRENPSDVGRPVEIGGVPVTSGMWIYADVDGVLIAPEELELPGGEQQSAGSAGSV
ncbi:ribonuclease E activity regulator RraA [uncultured Jannaschia sp.]|uniref:ribonuclease E activity regulator RraA n=1 Tax=uncultured Jannaschia sp. TaxID=293347 RepID=UPI002625C169|nr:ribonuclease E activity regulator RraA [uncultured Jannaschia sp.]